MKRKMAVRTEGDEQTMKRELWSFLSMEGGGGAGGGGVLRNAIFSFLDKTGAFIFFPRL